MQHTSLCSTLQPCFGHSWESIQILCNQSFKAPRSAIRFPHIPQYSDIERLRVLSVLQLQPVTRLQIRSLNPFDKAQSQAVAFRQIPTVLIRFTFTEISTIIPVFAASISIGDVWTCRKTKRSEEEEGGSQWDESWQIWGLLQLGRSYFAEASNRYTFQQLCDSQLQGNPILLVVFRNSHINCLHKSFSVVLGSSVQDALHGLSSPPPATQTLSTTALGSWPP
ncbi:Protein of unknown function [Pyronema omphalodes CBS 100304]|uniref:Uncharacterized protein n=1 Tax=Pyronema omphalodes (strain CBS 100304) TaxID=1076935 RepID=U4L2Y3_PYROM|nr:Protein of unknown function [Pyronema omphalodes CBS 100304]